MGTPRELLVQEVYELTELLQSDPTSAGARAALRERGVDPSDVLLAGLIGSEDNTEIGCLILPSGQVVEFETSANGDVVRWTPTLVPETLLGSYEAVLVGLDLWSARKRG